MMTPKFKPFKIVKYVLITLVFFFVFFAIGTYSVMAYPQNVIFFDDCENGSTASQSGWLNSIYVTNFSRRGTQSLHAGATNNNGITPNFFGNTSFNVSFWSYWVSGCASGSMGVGVELSTGSVFGSGTGIAMGLVPGVSSSKYYGWRDVPAQGDTGIGMTYGVWIKNRIEVKANGSIQYFINNSLSLGTSSDAISRIGMHDACGNRMFIDDICIYTNGSENNCYSNDTIPSVYNINITFFNSSNSNYNTTFIKNPFFMNINYSLNGVSQPSSVCSYNATPSMADLFLGKENYNISISNSNQNVTLNFTEHSGVNRDIITFNFCRQGTQQNPIQVYVNGGLFFTTTATIPSCSSGYLNIVNISTAYINVDSVNVSLRCQGCSVGQPNRIIPDFYSGRLISVERQATPYADELLNYNASTKLYDRPDHMHTFFQTGTNVVTINCNNTNVSRGMMTLTLQPLTRIEEINDNPFINGSIIELGNISILGECTSLGTSSTVFNVTFANNTLVASTTTDLLNITSDRLSSDGLYNISYFCNNSYGNTSLAKGYFNVSDTTRPQLIITNPSDNDTVIEILDKINITAAMYDLDLFQYNITCINPSGQDVMASFRTNITVTSVSFINSTISLQPTGVYTCNATVYDAHTSIDISKADIRNYQIDKKLLFKYKEQEVNISLSTGESFKIDRQIDRYSFTPETSNIDILSYRIVCKDGMVYRDNSRFIGHFVCFPFWIDFSMKDVIKDDYTIKKIWDNEYQIDIVNLKGKELKTESIGLINSKTEIFTFNVTNTSLPYVPPPVYDPKVSSYLFYFILGFFWVALLFAGFLFMKGILFLDGIYGVTLGIMFLGISPLPALVFIFINVALVIISAVGN